MTVNASLPKPITYECSNPNSNIEHETQQLVSEVGAKLTSLGYTNPASYGDALYFWLNYVLFARGNQKVDRQVGLLAGPTGCGKTESVKQMCKAFNIPLGICDVSNCVEEGIVGNSINGHITDLYKAVKKSGKPWDVPRVIVLDECHAALSNTTHYGNGIQRQMLALLGGENIKVSRTYSSKNSSETIPTGQVSVILSGSWDNILTRTSHSQSSPWENEDGQINGNELIGLTDQEKTKVFQEGGVTGELLGRLTLPPIIFPMPTKQELEQVLRRDNRLNPMPKLLAKFVHRTITLRPETVERITFDAAKRNLGYRSLRPVCEQVLRESLPALLNGASTI